MTQFLGEFLGTFILVLLGDGVVAGNVLSKTKEEGTGWTAIVFGWGPLLFMFLDYSVPLI